MEENQLPEKINTNKNKKTNNKNKKKLYSDNYNNDFIQDENNNFSNKSHKKETKSKDKYDKNDLKEEKNKKKKINSKKGNKSLDENKNLNNIKIKKLKKLFNKLNYIYLINVINKYYQRWLLQTFDIIEEESEDSKENEINKYKSNKDKEEEEEEEEEENDYGGDLEEIEERAPDEEESVITSVHSKTKIKRTNDILFALRKIIKYKNKFFRYFIRWYNAVELNSPTNEYKKIRKEKKLSNNMNTINIKKNNSNSNLNNINIIELKNPIYEVSSEEKIEDPKYEAKINLKNFIELKGTKRNALKKYYDIWHNATFEQNSSDSNNNENNEQNEYIFTYHGNFRNKDNIINPKIKIEKSNLTDDENMVNNKNKDEDSCKAGRNESKKKKQKAQCYVKKKVNSMKVENQGKNKKSKKKIKISDILKRIFIKINDKKLIFSALKNWKNIVLDMKQDISKVIFKKKQSSKIKKKTSNSRNKKKTQITKTNSKDNDSQNSDKYHKKNNFSIDEYINQKDKIKKIMVENKMNSYIEDEQTLSESSPIINLKKYTSGINQYQLNSDNSVNNSINTNSNTNEIVEQMKDIKEHTNKKGKKTIKREGSKKTIKSKEKKESNLNKKSTEIEEPGEEDLEKVKEKIEKICRLHKNQRAQRYLLISPPKIKKTKEKKNIGERQSFSSINSSLRFEKFKKKFMKLLLKTTCRQNPLMYNFDKWFNKTFNSKNYTPFLRKKYSNLNDSKIKTKASKTKNVKKSKKTNNEDKDNKKRDISADNANLNSSKIRSKNSKKINKIPAESTEKNEFLAYTNKAETDKYSKIKEILNQDIDSESSDNRLLFNDKKSTEIKSVSESLDVPRKSSFGSNKKYNKNKGDKKDDKIKPKNKASKKIKEKMESEEKIEDSPMQRKPGKKVQFSENYDNEGESKKEKKRYNNFGRDSILDFDMIENDINKKNNKRRQRQDLSSSFDIILNKKKKIIDNDNNYKKKKSKDDNNRKVNLAGINDYFKFKYDKDDINPDVKNIEITQDDDLSDKEKNHKKSKKSKIEKEEKKKQRLIKIYNKAMHLLRKAIRSFKKRNKTFDPDYEMMNAFRNWNSLSVNDNEEKNKLKDNSEDLEEKKINVLKKTINIINKKNKKMKGRLSEDEENYNYLKWCYNRWHNYTINSKEFESDNNLNMVKNSNYIWSSKPETYKKMMNPKRNNFFVVRDSDLNKNNNFIPKNEIKEKNNDKKNKKHIEPESLLDIELEDKKAKKHKMKRKKNSKNNNNSISSVSSSNKKEERDFDKFFKDELKENLDIISFEKNSKIINDENKMESFKEKENINSNYYNKNIEINKLEIKINKIDLENHGNSFDNNDNNNKIAKEEIKNNIQKEKKEKEIDLKSKSINEKSIFDKIRQEFPLNNDYNINTDYINEKEKLDKNKEEEEENYGVPQKVQPPPQVLALMKKQGKVNLPLPVPKNNLRLSYREFGKGNLEIVEPGELVSSERLKLVKKNLKRTLTFSSSQKINEQNSMNKDSNTLTQSSYFQNEAFNLSMNKKNYDEINKKIYPIFEKKDVGLFNKKKYFKIWDKNARNIKKKEINLEILPEVKKKSRNIPVIFLTKSIQEDSQEENNKINNSEDNNKENINENNNNENLKNMNGNNKNPENNNFESNSNHDNNFNNNGLKDSFDDNNYNIINKDNNNNIDNNYKNELINNYENNEDIKKYENENNYENKKEVKIENKDEKNYPVEHPEKIKNEKENEEEEEEEEEEEIEILENENKNEKLNNNENILNNKEDNKKDSIKIEINKDEKENLNIEEEINNNDSINYIQNEIKKETKENDLELIFKATNEINKTYNDTFNIIKNSSFNKTNNEITKSYIKLLEEQNKKIKAYQIFLFYSMFEESCDYYLKRNSFNKWKKNNTIFNEALNIKHIKSYDGHCISCSCEENNLIGQSICLKCNCNKIGETIKNILINQFFLKEMNPIKYYLFLWYKNVYFKNK